VSDFRQQRIGDLAPGGDRPRGKRRHQKPPSTFRTRFTWMAASGSNFLTNTGKRLKVKFAFRFLNITPEYFRFPAPTPV